MTFTKTGIFMIHTGSEKDNDMCIINRSRDNY